jgi:integrase
MKHSLDAFLSANDVHLLVTQSILRHKNMRTTSDVDTHAVSARQKEAQQKYLTAIGIRVPAEKSECCDAVALQQNRW